MLKCAPFCAPVCNRSGPGSGPDRRTMHCMRLYARKHSFSPVTCSKLRDVAACRHVHAQRCTSFALHTCHGPRSLMNFVSSSEPQSGRPASLRCGPTTHTCQRCHTSNCTAHQRMLLAAFMLPRHSSCTHCVLMCRVGLGFRACFGSQRSFQWLACSRPCTSK